MSSNNNLRALIIGGSVGVTIMFCVLWFAIDNGISDLKKQTRTRLDNIACEKTRTSLQIEFAAYDKKHVLIEPKEIEKINEHVKALTDEVRRESNRAESIIDKDLDRLNLYMAIGIGFMTLFGIFVPLLVNILTVQDVKDSQKELKTELISKAIELKRISNTIDNIGKKTDKMLPDVCNLMLQTAIARFFNVGPLVLAEAKRAQNYDKFINLFNAIKNAFTVCKKTQGHTITDNHNFIHTIEDFIHFLKHGLFRNDFLFETKDSYKEFENLIEVLQALNKSTPENCAANYEAVENKIDDIIVLLKNKNIAEAK